MTYNFIIPVLVSFLVSVIIGPILIPFLLRLKMGQTERELGVKSHLKKNGTPTMGGIIFILALTVVSIPYLKAYPKILPILVLTLGFGVIGFIDDYLKVVLRRSDGLLAWQKFSLQFILTCIFWFCLNKFNINLDLIIPFTNGMKINIGFWAVPILFFAIIGTVNGTNFTDGLDGLATSVTLAVTAFFAVVGIAGNAGISPIIGSVFGALLGFLVFNVYPAKIFMGDTGSLALGGFVAGCAYVLNMPLFLIIVGIIYVIEVLSVIMQVSYFKLTHGKRIFKMAPIHHHFELCGWSETKVVAIFTIITILMCFIAYMAL